MKKLSFMKMIQLAILVVLTFISACLLLNKDIKQLVFSDLAATILFVSVWVILVANFVFLLIDFSTISTLKLNYHNLYEVAFSDPLSGIPNRFSCDVLIEKYIDKDLPATIGCIVIDLVNLPDINTTHNHATGNKVLSQFSTILSSASASLGFVGRNGGNKFLAIFEECDQEKLNTFLDRVESKVEQHNAAPDALPIKYRAGVTINSTEKVNQITKLISLANQKVYNN